MAFALSLATHGLSLATLGISTAHAQDRVEVALAYSAPGACPDRESVADAVEALLERPVFSEDGTHLIRVEVVATPASASITLVRRDGAVVLGTRSLAAEGDCASLAAPLSLVLALLVDLSAQDIRLHLPAPARTAPQEVPARSGTEVSLALGGGVELGLGRVPTAVVTMGLGVAPLPFIALSFELAAQPFAEFRAELEGTTSVAVSALSLVTDLCGRVASAEGHALDLCGSVGVGGVLGRGQGFDVVREALVGWVVVGGAVRARIALNRSWFMGTTVHVGANVLAPSFAFRDAGQVVPLSAAASIEASASLIAGVRWGP